MKILEKDNWARMYLDSTPKLFEVCGKIMAKLKNDDFVLYTHLVDNEIGLEVALAGPLMTLFSNTANFSISTHVINCFILDGESYMIDLIVGIYILKRTTILSFVDQFEC